MNDCLLPPSELPATRLMESSVEYLTDSELLSLILRNGSVPKALALSRALLSRYGSIKNLSQASPKELMASEGIGQALACGLIAALEMARRLNAHIEPNRAMLQCPQDVAAYFQPTFLGKTQEEFHVVLLDVKNQFITSKRVTVGLVDRSQIHPRETFRPAIRHACSRVLLIHNHPSGDPTPSAPDISCTRQLIEAGKIVGIEVLDHIIIGHKTTDREKYWLSFREDNLM